MRPSGRNLSQMRPISIETGVMRHAEGSCLIRCGNTHVLCSASIEDNPPRFLKGTGLGWVTAEYGMLPRATNTRNRREAAQGKQSGRTQEIQRLIGRSLRAGVDRVALGEVRLEPALDRVHHDLSWHGVRRPRDLPQSVCVCVPAGVCVWPRGA